MQLQLTRGLVRDDGKVFWSYGKGYSNGEYWIDAELYDYKLEQSREIARKSARKHRTRIHAVQKVWRSKNKDRLRAKNLCRTFGISIEQYDSMHYAQHGLCGICGQPESAVSGACIRRLAVDHCHRTGKIRGLLCSRCNAGIGYLGDSTARLTSAINYLARFI